MVVSAVYVHRYRRPGSSLCYMSVSPSQNRWSVLRMCTVTARKDGGGGGSDTRWVKGEAVTSSFVAVVVLHDQY